MVSRLGFSKLLQSTSRQAAFNSRCLVRSKSTGPVESAFIFNSRNAPNLEKQDAEKRLADKTDSTDDASPCNADSIKTSEISEQSVMNTNEPSVTATPFVEEEPPLIYVVTKPTPHYVELPSGIKVEVELY